MHQQARENIEIRTVHDQAIRVSPREYVYAFDNATESLVKPQAARHVILRFAGRGELSLDESMLTSLRLAHDYAKFPVCRLAGLGSPPLDRG